MEKVILEVKGKAAVITINRPKKRNALNEQVRYESLKADRSLFCITLGGSQR